MRVSVTGIKVGTYVCEIGAWSSRRQLCRWQSKASDRPPAFLLHASPDRLDEICWISLQGRG